MNEDDSEYNPNIDSDGIEAKYKKGDRIVFKPFKHKGLNGNGVVVRQELWHDGYEKFWGDVYIQLDDDPEGYLTYCNNWQIEKVI